MINLPDPPTVKTVRQVICAACNEPFTVSEQLMPKVATWSETQNEYPQIHMRYDDHRQRRHTNPQSRSEPFIFNQQPGQEDEQKKSRPIYINCPRCGADNRNWILMQNRRPLLRSFWLAILGVLFCFGFGLFTAVTHLTFPEYVIPGPRVGESMLLLFVITATGIIGAQLTVGTWRNMRTWAAEQAVLPRQSWLNRIPPVILPGSIAVILSALVMPFVVLVIIPWGINSMFAMLDEPPPPSPLAKVNAYFESVNNVRNDPALDEFEESLGVSDVNTEVIPEGVPDTPAVETTYVDRWKPQEINKRLFITWVVNVLIGGFIAVGMAATAVSGAVPRMNGQLPRPIFGSVAQMTRVVIWETRRSLEIPGNLMNFQWTGVERNNLGGITLTGLRRDHVPEGEQYDISREVRGQQYEIVSDLWGHISEAYAKFVQVPPLPEREGNLLDAVPEERLPQEFFGHIPPPQSFDPNLRWIDPHNLGAPE